MPADAAGESIQARWRTVGEDPTALATFVRAICADAELWGADLAAIPGFADIVTEDLATIRASGAVAAIEALGLAEVR